VETAGTETVRWLSGKKLSESLIPKLSEMVDVPKGCTSEGYRIWIDHCGLDAGTRILMTTFKRKTLWEEPALIISAQKFGFGDCKFFLSDARVA
jgi:hypothetical protein